MQIIIIRELLLGLPKGFLLGFLQECFWDCSKLSRSIAIGHLLEFVEKFSKKKFIPFKFYVEFFTIDPLEIPPRIAFEIYLDVPSGNYQMSFCLFFRSSYDTLSKIIF